MEVKILNKGYNYLSCKLSIVWKNAIGTSQGYYIGKDVIFLMRFTLCTIRANITKHIKNIYIQFLQVGNKKLSVKLRSKFLNLNSLYAVDDSDWRLIYESEDQNNQQCEVDLILKITPLFEKPVNFAPLYEDAALTDFELRGEDGSVQIHSAALAACNPMFRTMLQGNWKETQERGVIIPQTSKATLQHLKDYIYLDVLPQSGVEDLLLLASIYMIDDLNEKCSDKIIETLTSDNFNAVLKFAVDNNLEILYKRVLECVQYGSIKVSDITKDSLVSDMTP